MRALILVLLVAFGLSVPASAAEVDPKVLVLSRGDVPAGYRVDEVGTGFRTNADEIRREPRLAALFRRWKRVTGYQSEFRSGSGRIEARVDLLAARTGARQMLDWYDREVRLAGLKGLRRSRGRIGDQAWTYASPPAAMVTIVTWRYGRVFAAVLGQGFPRGRALALARVQQRRMAAALR